MDLEQSGLTLKLLIEEENITWTHTHSYIYMRVHVLYLHKTFVEEDSDII
jgi:hypothetical protein